MEKILGAIQGSKEIMEIIHGINPNIPARPADRNFQNGGQHSWGDITHSIRGGRGFIGGHWECTNVNCKYYDQASLYDTIANSPGCTRKCTQCGDWMFNARSTCPNPPKKEQPKSNFSLSSGQTNLASWHGTRIRSHPNGFVDLSENNESWEKWTWVWLGEDKFLWVSCHKTFLRGNQNGSVNLAQKPSSWEVWTKEFHGDRHAWRSCHGTYLRAEPSGKVDLSNVCKEWELWFD